MKLFYVNTFVVLALCVLVTRNVESACTKFATYQGSCEMKECDESVYLMCNDSNVCVCGYGRVWNGVKCITHLPDLVQIDSRTIQSVNIADPHSTAEINGKYYVSQSLPNTILAYDTNTQYLSATPFQTPRYIEHSSTSTFVSSDYTISKTDRNFVTQTAVYAKANEFFSYMSYDVKRKRLNIAIADNSGQNNRIEFWNENLGLIDTIRLPVGSSRPLAVQVLGDHVYIGQENGVVLDYGTDKVLKNSIQACSSNSLVRSIWADPEYLVVACFQDRTFYLYKRDGLLFNGFYSVNANAKHALVDSKGRLILTTQAGVNWLSV